MRFEWDVEKNRANIRKHKIEFVQAVHAFSDPFRREYYDDRHSGFDEDRYIVAGYALNCVLLVSFTEPEPGIVRIISARKANKIEEEELYGKS